MLIRTAFYLGCGLIIITLFVVSIVRYVAIFLPQSPMLAYVALDADLVSHVFLFDVQRDVPVQVYEARYRINELFWSPDGKQLIMVTMQPAVRIIDVDRRAHLVYASPPMDANFFHLGWVDQAANPLFFVISQGSETGLQFELVKLELPQMVWTNLDLENVPADLTESWVNDDDDNLLNYIHAERIENTKLMQFDLTSGQEMVAQDWRDVLNIYDLLQLSPNGEYFIVGHWEQGTGGYQSQIVDSMTGEERGQVITGFEFVWSNNSQSIAYLIVDVSNSDSTMMRLNVESGLITQLYHQPIVSGLGEINWSPDDRMISFVNNAGRGSSLCLLDATYESAPHCPVVAQPTIYDVEWKPE